MEDKNNNNDDFLAEINGLLKDILGRDISDTLKKMLLL